MNGLTRKYGITGMAIVVALTGVVLLAGCGGSGGSGSASAETAGTQTSGSPSGGPGDMFASLTDEQKQCLDDAGVTIPDGSDMPQGQPPEGMTPPDGAPQSGATGTSGATGATGATGNGPPQGMTPPGGGQAPEGMQDLQAAMEDCGIDMPEPPQGSQAASGTTSTS